MASIKYLSILTIVVGQVRRHRNSIDAQTMP